MGALALAAGEFPVALRAQSPSLMPAYVGVVVAQVDGRAVPLERQTFTIEAHMRALGFGVASYLIVPGAHSPVRFHAGDPIAFVARVASPDVDPASLFTLSTIDSHKNERRLLAVGAGIGWRHGTQSAVPLTFEPYQRVFVKMVPAAPLAPGEYLFASGDGQTAFLFGVD